jgi:hypothetical protein
MGDEGLAWWAGRIEEFPVKSRLASIVVMAWALVPAMANAQTNLDQGKSASQIYTAACAECHKGAPRGLAHGKNASDLTEFLFDHYTTNRQQAAALAKYVLGGRGDEAVGGAPPRGQKPTAERNKPADEAKPEAQSGTKPEAKPTRRDARTSGKPEENAANPKRQQPAADVPKPEAGSEAKVEPKPDDGDKPVVQQPRRRREPKIPEPKIPEPKAAEQPASVVRAPVGQTPVEPAHAAATPDAAVPAASNAPPPVEGGPTPRDNIAD